MKEPKKNIVIKLRENEDRTVVFKMPKGCSQININLDLNSLKDGVIRVFWEPEELKVKKEQ